MSEWFTVHEAEPGIFIIEEPIHFERVKSHLVVGEERALLIDTGMGVANIRDVVTPLTDKPITVINSHAHWDHIGGNHLFDAVMIHPAEAEDLAGGVSNAVLRPWFQPEQLSGPLPEGVTADTIVIPEGPAATVVADGDLVDIGGRTLEIVHAPGHSPGGIALVDRVNGVLFSTDVAYGGALYVYSRDDLAIYQRSLARLAEFASELHAVYPSHNAWSIAPELLPVMARSVAEVIDGREPSWIRGQITGWEFDGFSLELKLGAGEV